MSGYTEIALLQYELEKLRAEIAALKAENESLRKEALLMRKSIIKWRQCQWPSIEQTTVVDLQYPCIAAMAKGEK